MDALKDYLGLRANLYRVLAAAWYKEPTNAWLARLKSFTPVFESMADETGEPALREGARLLKEAPGKIDEDAYAKKFAGIFLVNNAASDVRAVTPHESVYLSGSGLVMQDEWDKVLETFVGEGIGKAEDFKEPEDHIAAEMHFLALLSKQTAEYLNNGDKDGVRKKIETQARFLAEHTDKWVEPLKEHMEKLTDDPLYLAVTYLTAGFVHADTAFTGELAGEAVNII